MKYKSDYDILIEGLQGSINHFCQTNRAKTIGSKHVNDCTSCGLYSKENKCIMKIDDLCNKINNHLKETFGEK